MLHPGDARRGVLNRGMYVIAAGVCRCAAQSESSAAACACAYRLIEARHSSPGPVALAGQFGIAATDCPVVCSGAQIPRGGMARVAVAGTANAHMRVGHDSV